jgi:hypothetical protein
MRTSACPACLLGLRQFGRGKSFAPVEPAAASWADDLRLFATTFLAGFLFVSLYLA